MVVSCLCQPPHSLRAAPPVGPGWNCPAHLPHRLRASRDISSRSCKQRWLRLRETHHHHHHRNDSFEIHRPSNPGLPICSLQPGVARGHGGPPLNRDTDLFSLFTSTPHTRLRRGGAAEKLSLSRGGGEAAAAALNREVFSTVEPNGGPRGVADTVGGASPAGRAGAGAVRG